MLPLIPLIISLPLIVFWLWMFRDMLNNEYLPDNPNAPLTWPPSTKYGWTLSFIFLNFIAAGLYYFIEYRNRYL
ncbi:MAG: hypothetical protein ACM3PY_06230 [Omnitrophica WOR_2 bacterium]